MNWRYYVYGILAVAIATGVIIITLPGQAQITLKPASTTYAYNDSGKMVVGGVENFYLYAKNGTRILPLKTNISQKLNGNQFLGIRVATYPGNISITDSYIFDTSNNNLEEFPINHVTEIKGAKGLSYKYTITQIPYNGTTVKNPASVVYLGGRMKLGYLTQPLNSVLKKGSYTANYAIAGDDFFIYNRLFDPTTGCENGAPFCFVKSSDPAPNFANWSVEMDAIIGAFHRSGSNGTRVVAGLTITPWFDQDNFCNDAHLQGGSACNIGTKNLTAAYCMVTDQHSEAALMDSYGKNQSAYHGIYLAFNSTQMRSQYGTLPGWDCVVNETSSYVNCTDSRVNSNKDSASDATARYIISLAVAMNNPFFTNATQIAQYNQTFIQMGKDYDTYEVDHTCRNSLLGFGQICDWAASGGSAKAGGLASTDYGYSGYYGDQAMAYLVLCANTKNQTYCSRAANVSENYFAAAYPSGTLLPNSSNLSTFRVPPGRSFRWDNAGTVPSATCTNTCSPDYWDVSDAVRGVSICMANYYAKKYTNVTLPLADEYCLLWAKKYGTDPNNYYTQYFANGTSVTSAQSGYFAQGLEAQMMMGSLNESGVNATVWSAINHYADSPKTWDYAACFGVYGQAIATRSMGAAMARDYLAFSMNATPAGGGPVYNGTSTNVSMTAEFGPVNFTIVANSTDNVTVDTSAHPSGSASAASYTANGTFTWSIPYFRSTNLSTQGTNSWCYQNRSDVASSCGGVVGDGYTWDYWIINPENLTDENWNTYSSTIFNNNSNMYFAYALPKYADYRSSKMTFKYRTGSQLNFSVAGCIPQSDNKLHFTIQQYANNASCLVQVLCDALPGNGSTLYQSPIYEPCNTSVLHDFDPADEAMWWNITSPAYQNSVFNISFNASGPQNQTIYIPAHEKDEFFNASFNLTGYNISSSNVPIVTVFVGGEQSTFIGPFSSGNITQNILQGGLLTQSVYFGDSGSTQVVYLSIPKAASVKNATVTMTGERSVCNQEQANLATDCAVTTNTSFYHFAMDNYSVDSNWRDADYSTPERLNYSTGAYAASVLDNGDNVNHNGQAWLITSSRNISGNHYNISVFYVGADVVAQVAPKNSSSYTGWLRVNATNAYIYGNITADGVIGGGGGGGGGAAAVHTYYGGWHNGDPGAAGLSGQLGVDGGAGDPWNGCSQYNNYFNPKGGAGGAGYNGGAGGAQTVCQFAYNGVDSGNPGTSATKVNDSTIALNATIGGGGGGGGGGEGNYDHPDCRADDGGTGGGAGQDGGGYIIIIGKNNVIATGSITARAGTQECTSRNGGDVSGGSGGYGGITSGWNCQRGVGGVDPWRSGGSCMISRQAGGPGGDGGYGSGGMVVIAGANLNLTQATINVSGGDGSKTYGGTIKILYNTSIKNGTYDNASAAGFVFSNYSSTEWSNVSPAVYKVWELSTNWTKPYNVNNQTYLVAKDTNMTNNIFSGTCWSYSNYTLNMRATFSLVPQAQINYSCQNASSTWPVQLSSPAYHLFEDAMVWTRGSNVSDPAFPTYLSVEVGIVDGVKEFYQGSTFNTTNKTADFASVVNTDLAACIADASGFCAVPIYLTGTKGGVLVSLPNYTYSVNPNPIFLNNQTVQDWLDSVDDYTLIPVTFQATANATLQISDFRYDYVGGSKAYNVVLKHNQSGNIENYTITYYSTRWDYTMPAYTDFIEFIPTTSSSQRVTPYGQTPTTPIIRFTDYGYGGKNGDFGIISSETNPCITVKASFDNDYTHATSLTTAWQTYVYNLPYRSSEGIWMWADYVCANIYPGWQTWQPTMNMRACAKDVDVCDPATS